MERKILILIIFAFILVFFIFFFERAFWGLAQECPPPPSCPDQYKTEYQCSGSCPGAEIQKRSCTKDCWSEVTGTDAQGCNTYACDCGAWSCGAWQTDEACDPWQNCFNGGISTSKPSCKCDGPCLEAPTNPTPGDGAENISLPTNLVDDEAVNKVDWSDVPGFDESGGPQSYQIEVLNTDYEDVVGESVAKLPSCTFQSNSTNNWRVRACCTSGGSNCGPWVNWSFKTTLPPELVYPPDPDWEGSKYATPSWDPSKTYPVYLDWCDVPEAQSYYIKAYKGGEEYCPPVYPFCPLVITMRSKAPVDVLDSNMDFGLDFFPKETLFDWEVATCLKEGYQCGSACPGTAKWNDPCTEFSQRWSFFGLTTLTTPELVSPKNGEVVNMSHFLEWKHVPGARSYRYEIGDGISFSATTSLSSVPLEYLWKRLGFTLTTWYSWRVQPCWDEAGLNCQKESWSERWRFRTTGDPPTFNEPDSGPVDGATDILIPVKLNWDDMPGAASYVYELALDSGFSNILSREAIKSSESSLLDYPILRTGTQYWWRVRTCADEGGGFCGGVSECKGFGGSCHRFSSLFCPTDPCYCMLFPSICGNWSPIRSFTTFTLTAPTNPSPEDGGKTYPPAPLGWSSVRGARFYQYKVNYVSKVEEETAERCQLGEVIPLTVVSSNSVVTFLDCLGNYQWQVRACLDQNCEDAGPWSPLWSFTLLPPAPWGGLVPCGKYVDDRDTPWDERDPCEIKHFFLMIKNVLDFLLWKILPIILVVLVAGTGAMYYFAFGTPAMIARARSMLRAAGIGYIIVFLAWTLINIILKFFGAPFQWWIFRF